LRYHISEKFLQLISILSTQQPHKRTTPLIQILQGIPDTPDPDPEPEPRKEKGIGFTRFSKYSRSCEYLEKIPSLNFQLFFKCSLVEMKSF